MVDVILLERIERLGQMGDVVTVRPGFARNFLLPQKKALRATKANMQQFEQRKAQLVAENLKRREEAEKVSQKMVGLTGTVVRQAGESGQLYGSVTARDIAEVVTAGGFQVNRGQIIIDKPIKTVGVHTVRVSLHPEVSVPVKISIAPSQDEAAAQFKGGDAPAAAEPAEDEPAEEAVEEA
jgi:large subunit ribosomal protein L9